MMLFALSSAWTVIGDGLLILLACAVIVGTLLSFYLLLLAATSLHKPAEAEQGIPATRFAILIPAHEEELVIGRLLESVKQLDYPSELFEVHVIADHCSDKTACIARSFGVKVYERRGPDPQGKSWSLQWLVQRLLATKSGDSLDAFVVLDADSIVPPNFLRAMDSHLARGEVLIQGRVQVDDPGADRIGQLRALAYEFISHLRPLGRSALGLSVGLRGNGMCLTRDTAARFPWDTDSLAEDYELHARLQVAGLHVAFAPEAIVRTQLPQSLAAARTQSQRWERGRLDVMRRHVPALIGHGLRHLSWSSIDGAIELIIPPFSVFLAIMVALFGLSVLSGSVALMAIAAAGLVAQCLYTLRGVALAAHRYPQIHRALLLVPAFVAWRLWQYVAMLAQRRRVQWVRTVRTPASSRPARRICIIRHYYYPEDPRSRREAEALADAGHHVDILTLRHHNEPVREVINGVHVRRLPVRHYRGSVFHYAYEYSAFFFLSFLVLTARFVRHRYDVVQVNSLPDFLVFAALPCKIFRARLILDMHECTPELFCTKYKVSPTHPVLRVLGWVEQLSLAFADQVITCTPQQRAIFASRGTPAEKIAVVLNAANSAVFRPRTLEPVLWQPGDRFELVAHGLVAQRYGLDTMVRAVALLVDEIPDVVLHVYGKGGYLQDMEALASELGVSEKVIAHGFVPEEELLEGIARAHVGVIAAKRDSFRDLTHTQKMYEYVAMRKPVVIAETSAVRTHFDASCFQFFASDDPADLARALRELYYNPLRALEMIESSSRQYRHYSWEAQRHVYAHAVFGPTPQRARDRSTSDERVADMTPAGLVPVQVESRPALLPLERVAHAAPAEFVPVPVPVAIEAIPATQAIDRGGIVAPIEDGNLYLTGIVAPLEDRGI